VTVTLPRSLPVRLAVVAAAGLLAYSNSFGVPFQFDDGKYLLDPALASVSAFLASPHGASRIVGFFTFALDGSVHGTAVAGFHLVNLAIHLATAICVYFLTALACRTAAPEGAALRASAPAAGLVAALLFVAHPVQTEAVTYVIQRFSSLSTLFHVGAVLVYAHAVLAPSRSRRALLYASTGLLALLALFTKENAATLPLALAAFDLAVLPGTARQRLLRLSPFFAALAAAALVFLNAARGIRIASDELRDGAADPGVPTWLAHLLTQPRAVLEYLRLLAWPTGQSVDHDQPLYSRIASIEVLGPAAMVTLLLGAPAVLAWRARRRTPLAKLVLLGIAWFVLGVSVECVIPLADPIAEHRVYLPSVGLFLVAGAALLQASAGLTPRRRALVAVCAGTAIVALGAATWSRNRVWADCGTLWSDALAKAPQKSRPYVFVAQDLMGRGDVRGGLALLQRAATLPVVSPGVALNMGAAYARLGDLTRAEALFRDALDQGAGPMGAHRGLAQLLIESGRTAEGCEHVAAALELEPLNRLMRDYDASCRFSRGDVAGAAAAWTRLTAEAPRDGRILLNLALAHAALGDVPAAREAFLRFLDVAGPELRAEQELARSWIARHGAGR